MIALHASTSTPRPRSHKRAHTRTHLMNALISRMSGGVPSPCDSAVSPAIWPMTVLSPVPTTTPVPWPDTMMVEKNMRLDASMAGTLAPSLWP
jgi:hypothetical protein